MSNETKQPTLPEAIALVKEAFEVEQQFGCCAFFVEKREKALAALDSLQVSEPVVEYGWLVENGKQGDELRYRTWRDGIPSWTADHNEATRYCRRIDAERAHQEDEDAYGIAEHAWHGMSEPHEAVPCLRCAELEATNRQLNREVISVGDEAEDYAGKLAALEAFPKYDVFKTAEFILSDCGCSTEHAALLEKVRDRLFFMIDATIAQQAEQLRAYEEAHKDKQRLVRDLDVIWNGEEGAAQQASLCDIVAQIRRERTQQAERVRELTERDHAVARTIEDLLHSKHSLKEQLAAAEKLNSQRDKLVSLWWANLPDQFCAEYNAIDASIAASKEPK